MAGTYNRNTYNSALYNAGRDDAAAIIKSIIQAHTGPHIQAVVGADPRRPANQSGISFISDFTIIEGVVRRPPICYNFPDLKAVMRVMQTGSLDLDANVYAQQYFDMPACTYPVAYLPDLRAFIFAYIEHDLGADIFGILAQLDLGAILQIVQEDLGGFVLGIAAPNLGGRVFSQTAPNLGAIIWSPVDLPARITSVVFADMSGDIFAFHFGDMPARMLGIPAPKLFARIKGFASTNKDLPAVMFSRLEELLGATVTALYPGPDDMVASVASSDSDHSQLLGIIRSREPAVADLIATIGREFEVEFDLQATLNFLSAINLPASMGALPLGVYDRFLSGVLQPVHFETISAFIDTNTNLKNLGASIEALRGTSDLSAFLRAAETFVTAILTVSTLNAYDLRATIGSPDCAGGSQTALLGAFADAQHAKDLSGLIQSFVEYDLGATINLKEIFYAMDSISVTFSPKANRPVNFLTTDTIGVTFSPFRGLNLGAYIEAGLANVDLGAEITAIFLLPRVEPVVGSLTAAELRPDRPEDTQEVRFQLEGQLLDYFYVNGTSDAFISDSSEDWKINIRSFREITSGLFGDFAAGRVCRLGALTSYSSMDEAVRSCIAAVIGLQGESDMSARIFVSGGVADLPASVTANNQFYDLNALANRVFPVDLSATIGSNPYIPIDLKALISGIASTSYSMPAFLRSVNLGDLSGNVLPTGGYENLFASIPKVWKFSTILASLNVYNNQYSLTLNENIGDADYVDGPLISELGLADDVVQPFTVSTWFINIRAFVPTLYESIAGASDDFSFWNNGFGFNWEDPTHIRFWYNQWNVNFVLGTVDDNLQWLHLVGVYDGTDLTFYINGVLQGTDNAPGLTTGVAGDPRFSIGRIGPGTPTAQHSHGIFEDVSLWKRPLSSDEVFEIYNYGLAYNDLSVPGTFYTPDQQRVWWDMDNTSTLGTYPVITDRSPGNNDGTLIGAPVDENDALINFLPTTNAVSMDFPAGNCYFSTTTSDNGVPVLGAGSFSVMAVVRNQTSAFAKILGAWNSTQTGPADSAMQIRKFSSGFGNVVLSNVQNTTNSNAQTNFGTGLDTTGNTWYNLILTFDSNTGVSRVYMDGVYKSQTTLAGTRKSWTEFTIGAARVSDVIGEYWFAEIDSVAVWDEVLTGAQITAIYGGGSAEANLQVLGEPGNLAAWYRLGEAGDTLTTLQDKSGNGHHMVRIGTPSNIITGTRAN